MKHRFLDGEIYHKRFFPKTHDFKYKFFMLDIDLNELKNLENSLFSINKFNLFSFHSKDHFGNKTNFLENVDYLLKHFNIDKSSKMRFITLPSILGYVFNPISALVIFNKDKIPTHLIAEVHNYNGGRVLYPLELSSKDNKLFKGKTKKDMYVSPFFKRDGDYEISIFMNEDDFRLNIKLYENGQKMLTSTFSAKEMEYSKNSIKKLFFKHSFLTIWVVTRTLVQSFKLKLKGLSWNSPIKQDQMRRL